MGISRAIHRGALAAAVMTLLSVAGPQALAQGLRPSGNVLSSGNPVPAAAPSGQRSADYVVAMVNSEPVTNNEVRERALRLGQQLTLQGQEQPAQAELLQLALDMLINEKLQLQLAAQGGIKVDDTAVAQAEQNVAAQNRIPLSEVIARLEKDGISREQFRQTLRGQLTMMRLRDREVDSRVKITDAEVEQQLAELRTAVPAGDVQLNIAQVLIAVPESAGPAQLTSLQARAQKVYERVRAGEDFGMVAREISDAPEASNGGQFGLRPAERYPELFVQTVTALNVGGVAAPVRSGAGFHVLKLIERIQPGVLPSAITQSRARHILLRLTPQLGEAEARSRLEAIRRTLQSGTADFATLARQHSQDGSAREGGDLGWVTPGQFVPEFEDAMNALSPGQISAPVSTRFGVHLIQLVERREMPLGDRERRGIARNQLRQKKVDEAFSLWMQEIRGNAFVQLREPPR
jgi:peptidyl-prolyl cis-trans isomerase SurA